MRIHVDKKPTIVEADTKELLDIKIENRFRVMSHTYGTYGSCRNVGLENPVFIMVNYQKFRSKRGKRKAHWVGYVYHFKQDFLKANNLKVTQKSRNFEIKKRS